MELVIGGVIVGIRTVKEELANYCLLIIVLVCDAPWHAVENLIDHLKEEHPDASIIYYTGDVVDHGVWETSQEHNINMLRKLDQYFAENLPGVSIFQAIGNHEANPTDQ